VYLHSARCRVVGGVLIDLTTLDLASTETWCAYHGVQIEGTTAVLYKATDAELTAGQQHDKPTVYQPGTEVVATDWRDDDRCGGGLHLSPWPHQAAAFVADPARYLRCEVDVADIRVIPDSTPKCKVPRLRVVAEVDLNARPITETSGPSRAGATKETP
jgi:hypothetical protein